MASEVSNFCFSSLNFFKFSCNINETLFIFMKLFQLSACVILFKCQLSMTLIPFTEFALLNVKLLIMYAVLCSSYIDRGVVR